jgi:uncharacterized membrane protein
MGLTYPLIFIAGFAVLSIVVIILSRFQDWFYGIDSEVKNEKVEDHNER